MSTRTDTDRQECPLCKETFASKRAKQRHLKTDKHLSRTNQSLARVHVCDDCGTGFTRAYDAQRHKDQGRCRGQASRPFTQPAVSTKRPLDDLDNVSEQGSSRRPFAQQQTGAALLRPGYWRNQLDATHSEGAKAEPQNAAMLSTHAGLDGPAIYTHSPDDMYFDPVREGQDAAATVQYSMMDLEVVEDRLKTQDASLNTFSEGPYTSGSMFDGFTASVTSIASGPRSGAGSSLRSAKSRFSVTRINTIVLRASDGGPPTTARVPLRARHRLYVRHQRCGVCNEAYADDETKIRQHSEKHLTELNTESKPWECGHCQVRFAHSADLKYHLQVATVASCCGLVKGHSGPCRGHKCGFNFKHSLPCDGHHPPARFKSEWINDDHARLRNILESWEQAQLHACVREVEKVRDLRSIRAYISNASLPVFLKRYTGWASVNSTQSCRSEPMPLNSGVKVVTKEVQASGFKIWPLRFRFHIYRGW